MPTHNIFYFCGHGALDETVTPPQSVLDFTGDRYDSDQYNEREINADRTHWIHTPSNQERTYWFVMLNCCSSADASMHTAFAATAFVGWQGEPYFSTISDFNEKFWEYIKRGENTKKAMDKAWSDINHGHPPTDPPMPVHRGTPLVFTGR